MTSPGSEEASMRARSVWVLTPLESVGPLRFGMSMDEASIALPELPELRRFKADPWSEAVGIQLGLSQAEPAVYEYFDASGRLFCVAIDAVRGPQVTLDRVELAGGAPAKLETGPTAAPTTGRGRSPSPSGSATCGPTRFLLQGFMSGRQPDKRRPGQADGHRRSNGPSGRLLDFGRDGERLGGASTTGCSCFTRAASVKPVETDECLATGPEPPSRVKCVRVGCWGCETARLQRPLLRCWLAASLPYSMSTAAESGPLSNG
jgi:hypothetical protein